MNVDSTDKESGKKPLDCALSQVAVCDSEINTSARHRQWIGIFLIVGVFMRCSRFLLNFPLWEDECFLVINYLDRGYLELLEPLRYHQVAPVCFLWIELTMVKLFGFHEFALRLFPLICSLAGVLLFSHVARRLLSGSALVLAIGLFAVSYPNMRYAAEAKQYASDMLVGLIYLAMSVEWWRLHSIQDARAIRWFWGMCAFTPLALGLSYPAVFSAGAASVLIAIIGLLDISKSGLSLNSFLRSSAMKVWVIFNALLLGSFLVILKVVSQGQSSAELSWMETYWSTAFPPSHSLADFSWWMLKTHCGALLAFPLGGNQFASSLTTLCVAIGLARFMKQRRLLAIFLVIPAFLHLIAASLHRYPYGEHFKFSMHMAGIICLLAGLGSAGLLMFAERLWSQRRWGLPLGLAYLLLVGAGITWRDYRSPHKTESDMQARAFAQWFWPHAAYSGEIVCVENDLGIIMTPDAQAELSWAVMYRVNREIYAPETVGQIDESKLNRDHPLRCVIYRVPAYEFDDGKFDDWMRDMETRYELVDSDEIFFPRYAKHKESRGRKKARTIDSLQIYEFIPRTSRSGRLDLAKPTAKTLQQ